MSAPYLRVRNWDKFQHYKKDGPVGWIKLHTKLLSDYEWMQETPTNRLALVQIWLLAGQLENRLPNDAAWLRKRISARTLDLEGLISRGWLEPFYSSSSLGEKRREEVPQIGSSKPRNYCSHCRAVLPPHVSMEDHRRMTHGLEVA